MPCYLPFFRNLHVALHLSPANSHFHGPLQTPQGIFYTCSYFPFTVYFLPTLLKLALPPHIETATVIVTTIWIPHPFVEFSPSPTGITHSCPGLPSPALSTSDCHGSLISGIASTDRVCLLSPLLPSPLCHSSSFPLSLSSTWQPIWNSQKSCTCLYLYVTIFSSIRWLNPTYTINIPKFVSPT